MSSSFGLIVRSWTISLNDLTTNFCSPSKVHSAYLRHSKRDLLSLWPRGLSSAILPPAILRISSAFRLPLLDHHLSPTVLRIPPAVLRISSAFLRIPWSRWFFCFLIIIRYCYNNTFYNKFIGRPSSSALLCKFNVQFKIVDFHNLGSYKVNSHSYGHGYKSGKYLL